MTGFRYGYYQGTRATEAEIHKKPVEKPTKIKDLRQAIIYTVNKTRNSFVLNNIYKIADLLRRRMDDKGYATLTETEWKKTAIISSIVVSERDQNIKLIDSFIRALEGADRKRGKQTAEF